MRRVTEARLVVSLAFIAASIGPARGQDSISETRRKVAELEAKVAGLPPGTFDFGLHNDLRHLYGALDERKSMIQCDIIFRNSFLDDYMFQVLGGKDPDPGKAIQALTAVARRYPDLPDLAAACWIRSGDLVMATDRAMARRITVAPTRSGMPRRGIARPPRTGSSCRPASEHPGPVAFPHRLTAGDHPGPGTIRRIQRSGPTSKAGPTATLGWPSTTTRSSGCDRAYF